MIGSTDDQRERLINVFAIHLQLPADTARGQFHELTEHGRPRDAAIVLAAKYKLSWSALCTHLRNIGSIDASTFGWLIHNPPNRVDWAELGLVLAPERDAPIVPPSFARAAINAYKKYDLTAERTVELLRGAVDEDELPVQSSVPLEALSAEL